MSMVDKSGAVHDNMRADTITHTTTLSTHTSSEHTTTSSSAYTPLTSTHTNANAAAAAAAPAASNTTTTNTHTHTHSDIHTIIKGNNNTATTTTTTTSRKLLHKHHPHHTHTHTHTPHTKHTRTKPKKRGVFVSPYFSSSSKLKFQYHNSWAGTNSIQVCDAFVAALWDDHHHIGVSPLTSLTSFTRIPFILNTHIPVCDFAFNPFHQQVYVYVYVCVESVRRVL